MAGIDAPRVGVQHMSKDISTVSDCHRMGADTNPLLALVDEVDGAGNVLEEDSGVLDVPKGRVEGGAREILIPLHLVKFILANAIFVADVRTNGKALKTNLPIKERSSPRTTNSTVELSESLE